MGQTGSAKICGFLRFSAKICGFLRLRNAVIPRKAKSSKDQRKTANLAPFVPFSLSLLLPLKERKRHINLRKSLGHRPGVPGTPGGGGVPRIFPVVYCGKELPFLPGHRSWQKRPAGQTVGFSENLFDFSYVPFSAPEIGAAIHRSPEGLWA